MKERMRIGIEMKQLPRYDECCIEQTYEPVILNKKSYPNLYMDRILTSDDLVLATDIIYSYMIQNKSHTVLVDLELRNELLGSKKKNKKGGK